MPDRIYGRRVPLLELDSIIESKIKLGVKALELTVQKGVKTEWAATEISSTIPTSSFDRLQLKLEQSAWAARYSVMQVARRRT